MTRDNADSTVSTIQYAVPVASHGAKVWAGVAVMLGGLGLVVLGGCFLIGVMLTSANGFNGPAAGPNNSGMVLIAVLYTLAAIAFVCAGWVLVIGLRALLRVVNA